MVMGNVHGNSNKTPTWSPLLLLFFHACSFLMKVHFVRVGLDSHYRGYRLGITSDNICRDTAMPMAIQTTDRAVGLLQNVLIVASRVLSTTDLVIAIVPRQNITGLNMWLEFGQWFSACLPLSQALLCDYNRALDLVVASWLHFVNKRASFRASLSHRVIQCSQLLAVTLFVGMVFILESSAPRCSRTCSQVFLLGLGWFWSLDRVCKEL